MSDYCDHEWKTYNSGWTMYEYCVKCDVKKPVDTRDPMLLQDDPEFKRLIEAAMKEVKAMELPVGSQNKLWKPV